MTISRDDILAAVKVHKQLIIEADEWRPLADYILALVKLAYNSGVEGKALLASEGKS